MDVSQEGYQPPPEYKEDDKEPLSEISSTDSTELWLIQWPINQLQPDDFEGKEISLKLHRDGKLGSFESSSGKSYDFVSFAAQEPDATVFLASASKSKVVGKISRRVCLVHYPEPGNIGDPSSNNRSSDKSSGSLRREISNQFATPVRSKMQTHSSNKKSSLTSGTLSVKGEPSKSSKQRRVVGSLSLEEPMRSVDRSTRDSGQGGRSSVSSLGHSDVEVSHQGKSKKKKIKVEE